MNFKEFLSESRKTTEAYNFEKIKKELIDAVIPLHKYLRNNYKDKYFPLNKEGVEVSDYGSVCYIELYADLKNQEMGKDDSELRELLQHCMKEAKKIFKKYGLVQDKEHKRPSSAARTAKRIAKKGKILEVEFYIGWVKPKP